MIWSLALFCCLAAPSSAGLDPAHHYLWLECEQFDDLGGWWPDSQFIDLMGSTQLLAQGLRGPVDDAVTSVELPAAGRWTVFARTRNWLPEYTPGTFTIRIGGQETNRLGNLPHDRWVWQRGGTFQLAAGHQTLALHDLTGEYGRCDAVLLTDDPDFYPAADPQGYHDQRYALTGINGEFDDAGSYDVVVVGGGLAGSFAAIAAARHGAKTILIQDRPILGGNASEEIGVRPEGATANRAPYAREGGLPEEGWRETMRLGSWSKALEALTSAEPNLTRKFYWRAQGVEQDNSKRITAVTGRDVRTGQGWRVRGRLFCDCTGDGTLGYLSGCEIRWGSEPKSMYGESMAPEVGDRQTMGNSLYYHCERTDQPQPFTRPAWAHNFPDTASLHGRVPSLGREGYWWIEWGGEHNTITDAEMIRDNLWRILYGVWDYLKNRSGYVGPATNFQLVWVGKVAGKRENRRIIGDHVMTQQEVQRAELYDDRVAFGGWTIDLHPPKGMFDEGRPAIQVAVPLYSIPFRSLYAKDVPNLMMAGRDISVSRVALGTTRVMLTCGTQGQAIGTAAGICLDEGLSPRQVAQTRIGELQRRLLRDDAHIIDLPLKEDDNLAQRASITASSFVASEPYSKDSVTTADRHELNYNRAVKIPSSGKRLEAIDTYLENASDKPLEVTVALRIGKVDSTSPPKEVKATAKATVPPGKHWVNLKYGLDVPADAGLWFVIPPTKDLWWFLAAGGPEGSSRGYAPPDSEGWTPRAECYALVTDPSAHKIAGSEPQAVADGQTRPTGGDYHGWVSDASQPLPQWVALNWAQPQKVGRVELVFDTDFAARRPTQLVEKQVVTKYRIEVADGDGWKTVVEEEGNDRRLRKHTFAAVTTKAVRLTVLETGGDKAARVYELRAYER